MKLALSSNHKRSPLRQQLAEAVAVRADAIKARDDAAAKLSNFKVALSATGDIYYAAYLALEKAERDFAEAMRIRAGSETQVAEDAIRDGRPHPRKLIGDLRKQLEEAEENKRLGNEGLIEVEALFNIAERDLRYAEDKAVAVVHMLEREALPLLLKEADVIQNELIDRRAVIQHLVRSIPDMQFSSYRRDEDSLRVDVSNFLHSDRLFGRSESSIPAATAPWDASRVALLVDPDAPLPVGTA